MKNSTKSVNNFPLKAFKPGAVWVKVSGRGTMELILIAPNLATVRRQGVEDGWTNTASVTDEFLKAYYTFTGEVRKLKTVG